MKATDDLPECLLLQLPLWFPDEYQNHHQRKIQVLRKKDLSYVLAQ